MRVICLIYCDLHIDHLFSDKYNPSKFKRALVQIHAMLRRGKPEIMSTPCLSLFLLLIKRPFYWSRTFLCKIGGLYLKVWLCYLKQSRCIIENKVHLNNKNRVTFLFWSPVGFCVDGKAQEKEDVVTAEKKMFIVNNVTVSVHEAALCILWWLIN